MILRKFMKHVRDQNWFAVTLDVIVVITGIFLGMQVTDWNEQHKEEIERKIKMKQVILAINKDLIDFIEVTELFSEHISKGLDEWEKTRARGEMPSPYYFRINGSVRPPMAVWEVIKQAELGDILKAETLFTLGYFYNELSTFGEHFVRYSIFLENEILPLSKENNLIFYDQEKSALRLKYKANMDRLRELDGFMSDLRAMARCMIKELEQNEEIRLSCRTGVGTRPLINS